MTTAPQDRDLPNATLFKSKVRSSKSLGAVTVGRTEKDTGVSVVCLPAAPSMMASNPLYYLQAIRSNARDRITGATLCEAEYRQIESHAVDTLTKGVDEYPFDAMLAAPTTRRCLQEPYLKATQSAKPGVADLTTDLTLIDSEVSSHSAHSLEERIANLKWDEGRDWATLKHILILDDVVSRGRTAVPLIHSIRDQYPPGQEPAITLCAPLWIIRTDAESWITPVHA